MKDAVRRVQRAYPQLYAPEAGGTRLTITEDGFVKNPVFRLLSKTVFSPTASLERFLADLGAHLAA